MFETGEYVVHGRAGVCKIEKITKVDISGADKEQLYYVMIPVSKDNSRIFCPVDSQATLTRPVVSGEEAQDLLNHLDNVDTLEIKNEKQRETAYKNAIAGSDCEQLLSVIKTLRIRAAQREKEGKKTTSLDDKYLNEAAGILYEEFSVALDMNVEQVEEYISSYMKW